MKQTKLIDREPQENRVLGDASRFRASYPESRVLRNAFEVIHRSSARECVTIEVSGREGLRVKTLNLEETVGSALAIPPASFEELEGKGTATVNLDELVRMLDLSRKRDSAEIETDKDRLVVRYRESGRTLSAPLLPGESEELQMPELELGASLKVRTGEFLHTLKDLSRLDVEVLKIAATPGETTVSRATGGTEYEKRFTEGDDEVMALNSPRPRELVEAEYSLDAVRRAVSNRFESLTLSFGDALPARIDYSLDEQGGRLAVLIAPHASS